MNDSGPLLVRNPGLASIEFAGPEAAPFLHNQLSTDVEAMAAGDAAWTSYNSPKGRMLATLFLWRRQESAFIAYLPSDIAEPIRKRLAMFVLRAKVTVALRDRELTGFVGTAAKEALAAAFGAAPAPGHGMVVKGADVVALPDGRFLIDAPEPVDLAGVEGDRSGWDWLGVRAGIPQITSATQDLFVPQTTNFDLVGGINFRKGCYPGQEIVARMQYLGRLKERMFAFSVDAEPPASGTRIVAGTDNVGTVINAAAAPDGGSDLLAVVSLAALEAGGLRLGSIDGPALAQIPLPYDVPAPAVPNRVKL